ncbi:hypothetical protein [Zavarzinia compransoris]|uniref:DUF1850 domain-containing protein n=1 Tax=Zavarzinia compransoris TaxID=1264899 RepID=A0A317EBD1_9PROT|nr:hypothetical protein [Zavarzinia compransoris]PWR23882.1 hypothetical protein DKG75_04845 [Zavarzinia compransoris]TDP48124.1 hypothetical protein DES42_102426 [Zavarzinia compransoris]
MQFPHRSFFGKIWPAALLGLAALQFVGTAAAQQPATREIRVVNKCRLPINLLIEHADGYRNWHPHAWYRIDALASTGLKNKNGDLLRQSDGLSLYYYAESVNGRYFWQGTDSSTTWNNTTYRLRKAATYVSEQRLTFELTCD